MPLVDVNGTELFVERRGDAGDPMVLVHGSWVDHRTWNVVLPKLAGSFSVVAYDRRGHGRSARVPGPYRIADDVADLVGVLEKLDHYPAHVVGLSLGGTIALRLAAERADLFRSVVVHEPPIYSLLEEASPGLAELRARGAAVAARINAGDRRGAARMFLDAVASTSGDWDRIGPAGQELLVAHADRWLAEYEGEGTFDLDPTGLSEFYAPALLTSGELGPPTFGRILDALAPRLPNVTRQRLPGTGHLPHLTDPDLYVGVLFSFCAERNVPVS
jgi:pimeloyl-ACP methyl ester carboxylesterase